MVVFKFVFGFIFFGVVYDWGVGWFIWLESGDGVVVGVGVVDEVIWGGGFGGYEGGVRGVGVF